MKITKRDLQSYISIIVCNTDDLFDTLKFLCAEYPDSGVIKNICGIAVNLRTVSQDMQKNLIHRWNDDNR